jgi:hypothetical protein
MNFQEARAAFMAHKNAGVFAEKGISWDYGAEPLTYVPDEWRNNYALAMDAQPALVTSPNSAIPTIFTAMVDPTVYKILFAPNEAAVIFGEMKKGSWVDDTILFPTVEHGGEVSSYADYSESGMTTVNMDWPQRQNYIYQTHKEYGDRELERAGLAKINWIVEKDQAAATIMNKFENLTYFFGVQGLQNYGLLNDPSLSAALTPSTKTDTGGTVWINTSTGIIALPTEIYNDILFLYEQLVVATQGLVNAASKLVLGLYPGSEVALGATNSFGLNVHDMLKKNFPNLRIQQAVQYGKTSASNPQGITAGNLIQLFAEDIEGQDTGFCAFSEKMRAHPIIRQTSSYRQKISGGTWGAIIRMPIAIVSMVGV